MPKIGCPLAKMSATPRTAERVPRVTTNGETRKVEITSPLNKPTRPAAHRATAAPQAIPTSSVNWAMMTLTSAKIAPTERVEAPGEDGGTSAHSRDGQEGALPGDVDQIGLGQKPGLKVPEDHAQDDDHHGKRADAHEQTVGQGANRPQ